MEKLKRYTLPIVLGALALIALVVGILAVTVWKPSQEVSAQRETTQPFIATREGVLRLYEPYQESGSVRVEATAPEDQTIWIALGSAEDVRAWLADDPYDEIVGLESLETLKTVLHEGVETPQSDEQETTGTAEETPQSGEDITPSENPIDSDMWTALKYGRGTVSMTLTADELDQMLLAATDGVSPAPTIKLTWDTPQPNVLAMISFPMAAALAVLSLGTFIALFRSRSKKFIVAEAAAPALVEPASDDREPSPDYAPKELELGEETPLEESPVEERVARADEIPAVEIDAQEEALEVDEMPIESSTVPEGTIEAVSDEESAEPEPQDETEVVDEVDVESPQEISEVEEETSGVEETVSTDSGMISLSSLNAGLSFPTRRALREAEKRGVDALVVGDRRFATKTGQIPKISLDDVNGAKSESSGPTLSWRQLLDRANKNVESEPENPENEGE